MVESRPQARAKSAPTPRSAHPPARVHATFSSINQRVYLVLLLNYCMHPKPPNSTPSDVFSNIIILLNTPQIHEQPYSKLLYTLQLHTQPYSWVYLAPSLNCYMHLEPQSPHTSAQTARCGFLESHSAKLPWASVVWPKEPQNMEMGAPSTKLQREPLSKIKYNTRIFKSYDFSINHAF